MPINRFTALFNGRRRAGSSAAAATAPNPVLVTGLPGSIVQADLTSAGADNGQPEHATASLAGRNALAAAAAAAATSSSGAPSRRLADVRDSKVQEWLRVANRNRIGPKLHALREEHRRAGLPLEQYSVAHVYQLGTARQIWVQQPREYCKNIHRKRDHEGRNARCTQCTTCHWCRQKTTCIKTQCAACHGNRDNIYGGPYAGVICGNCLWTRFGENLNEVLHDPSWTCPACRQICNCSANNCVRNKHGWICTDQINTEATSLGYDSVAHYLVLAQLDESLWANITDNVNSLQPMVDRAVMTRAAAVKRQRNEKDTAARLQEAAAPVVERELASVRAAAGFSAQQALKLANSNQQLLADLGFGRNTFTADLQDEDEDEDDEDLPSTGLHQGAAAVRVFEQPAAPRCEGVTYSGTAADRASGEQQWLPGPLPPFSLCTALGGTIEMPGSQPERRLPPRPPGRPPLQLLVLEAPMPAGGAPNGGTGQGQQIALLSVGAEHGPAAPTADGAAALSSRPARASPAGERQQQLEGLLHQDHQTAFPAGLPGGDVDVPAFSATGHWPATCAASHLRQPLLPGAALLSASLPQHQPLRQQLQQQARLTPMAAVGSKQQQLQAVREGATHAAPMPQAELLSAPVAEDAVVASDWSRQQEMEGHTRKNQIRSPMQIPELSQKLGPSPDDALHAPAAAGSTACQLSEHAAPRLPSPQAETSAVAARPGLPPVTTPVPPVVIGVAQPRKHRNYSGFAVEWGHLLRSAEALMEEIGQNDPTHPSYRPNIGVATVQDAEDHYRDVYVTNMMALQDVLTEANQRLAEPLVFNNCPGQADMHTVKAVSIDALHPLIKLYTHLASVLSDDAVKWQIAPRLLLQDCFVDFERSHSAARLLLVEGMMDLLHTLHQRHMCIKDTCQTIASAVATLATDLHKISELLSDVLDALQGSSVQQLPTQDRRIGAYVYDAQERNKGVGIVYSKLEANYNVVEDVLRTCLVQCMSAARLLGHDAGHLLDPVMMQSLLGANRSMPRDVKRAALGLMFTVLSLTSDANEQQHSMNLSVEETNRRREHRLHLCQVVRELLPLLEGLLSAEYPLWRPVVAAVATLPLAGGGSAGSAAATGAPSGTGTGGDSMGQEAMTALGRAYAFLLECQQMTWQQLEEAILRPYMCSNRNRGLKEGYVMDTTCTAAPLTFWQLSNRVYRCFSMALLADTLQRAPSIQTAEQHLHVWMLKHWLLSLLDRGRWFMTGESLAVALSKQTQLAWLFAGLQPIELAIGNDHSGKRTASLLGSVFGRLCMDSSWWPLLGELLRDVDELLERREKEMAGSEAQTKMHRLRYGRRLYRLLSAILLAAAPVTCGSAATAANAPGRLGSWAGVPQAVLAATSSLQKLAQRMALLAVGSCLAVHRDYHTMQTENTAGSSDDVASIMLCSKADVRQRLQRLPFGELGSLWRVLLAWGAPQDFARDQGLLKPMWTVVCCTLEICSGSAMANPFDEVVLERLADSLHKDFGNHVSSSGLSLLREYVLTTFVRRYLSRSHFRHVRNERTAVNAVRFLQAMLESLHSTGGADAEGMLVPLLQSLLGTLWPLERDADPSLAVREAVHRMLAQLLEWCPHLLPPLAPIFAAQSQKALNAFWKVAAGDAVLACQQPVLGCLDEAKRQEVLLKTAEFKTSPKLLPLCREMVVNASNMLFRLLGPPKNSLEPLEQLGQRQNQQLELMLKEGTAGGSSEQPSNSFRPADFNWTAVGTSLKLVAAFLQAGKAEAVPHAASSPGVPCVAAAASMAAGKSWQKLPPGYQWALACIPALNTLIVLGKDAAQPLKKPYMALQKFAQRAMPGQFSLRPQPILQQLQQPAVVVQPAASIMVGNMSSHVEIPLQQQQPRKQESLSSQAVGSLAQQQVVLHTQQLPPAVQLPGQQQQLSDASQQRHSEHVMHYVRFDAMGSLARHSKVAAVGVLAKRPEVKVGANSTALKLELWDHRRAKLVLLVPRHHALYQQLQDEANQRLDKSISSFSRPMLRIMDALLLDANGAAAKSEAGFATSKVPSCVLQERSRVEWEPSGELADKIRRAVATGRLQLPNESQVMQQQGVLRAAASIAAQPTAHRLQTQLTPVMHWTEQQTQRTIMQQQAQAPCRANATQVEEASTTLPQCTQAADASRVAARTFASQAKLSQADSETANQQQQRNKGGRAAAAAGEQWRRLALDVVALCKPLPGNEVIRALKGLAQSSGSSRQQLLAQGAHQVAARVQSVLT